MGTLSTSSSSSSDSEYFSSVYSWVDNGKSSVIIWDASFAIWNFNFINIFIYLNEKLEPKI